jgi:hypothetical protein
MVRISETLKERLVKLASQLFPYNNKVFEAESVGKMCRVFETIDPGEYRQIHRELFLVDAANKEWDALVPLTERLEKLAIRLDDDGFYVDADICWQALRELKGKV